MKITSILFPVDFSVSDHAVDFVIDVAKHTGAYVTLYHANEIPQMADMGARPLLIENQQEIVESQFKEMEAKYPDLKLIPHRFDSTSGSLERGIEYFLENENERVDLIVMGTAGAKGVKEFFAGSRTMQVIEKSSVPVLVIPEKAQFKRPKKIAFAYDYNGIINPSVLDALKSLVGAYQAELHIFNIAENARGYRGNDLGSIDILEKEFGAVKYDTRIGSDIEKEIENYVMLNEIDVLAVMPREHGFFEIIFTETISEKLTYHALVPLLVLR